MGGDVANVVEDSEEGGFDKMAKKKGYTDQACNLVLKIIRKSYIQAKETRVRKFEAEVRILEELDHPRINKFIASGSEGVVLSPSGEEIDRGLYYMLLEYVPGTLLWDLCQATGPMGEDCTRFFAE